MSVHSHGQYVKAHNLSAPHSSLAYSPPGPTRAAEAFPPGRAGQERLLVTAQSGLFSQKSILVGPPGGVPVAREEEEYRDCMAPKTMTGDNAFCTLSLQAAWVRPAQYGPRGKCGRCGRSGGNGIQGKPVLTLLHKY